MLDEKTLKQFVAIGFITVVLLLSFLILKPIAMAILFGLILAYVFYPFYKLFLKFIKNENITAILICILVLVMLFLSVWFLVPLLANQVFDAFSLIQSWDITGTAKKFFPFLFNNPKVASNFEAALTNFVSSSANSIMGNLTDIILNLPFLLLHSLVVLIVFFYTLRDGDKILDILRELTPFSKSITNKFIRKSSDVTFSVVFGRVVIGIIVGLLTGFGFFLAGIPNSFLLTFIAIIVSIIPIIGPWLVWIPVTIGLIIANQTLVAILLLIYNGIFIYLLDNVLHVLIVSKRAKVSIALTFVGLMGGIFVFGIFGIILGPLIMAYLEVLYEIYRDYRLKKEVK